MDAATLQDLKEELHKELHHQELKLEELLGLLLILTALDTTDTTNAKPEEKLQKKLQMLVEEETTDLIELPHGDNGFNSKDVAIPLLKLKEFQLDGLIDLVMVKEKTATGLPSTLYAQDTVAEPMIAQNLILNRLLPIADQDGETTELTHGECGLEMLMDAAILLLKLMEYHKTSNQELLQDQDGGLQLTQLVPDMLVDLEDLPNNHKKLETTLHIAELMNGFPADLILGLLMYTLFTTEENVVTLPSFILKFPLLKDPEFLDAGLLLTHHAQDGEE